jgi:Na+/H+ antiporter NhaD/arsenite permease-like protein
MMYYAVTVFVVAYAFIISERFKKTTVALVGAELMVCLPVMDSPDVFYLAGQRNRLGRHLSDARDDDDRQHPAPDRCVRICRDLGGQARQRLTAAHHDAADAGDGARLGRAAHVVSVSLIAPVTLLVCDALEVNPVPLLLAEVSASNVGGAATLVGDPPNIIIGARKSLSFNAFLANMAPIVIIVMLVLLAASPLMFRAFPASVLNASLPSCRCKRVT